MEKRINTVQLSISFPDDIYEDLRKLAVRKHMSMAGIVRSFVADGLTVESHDENKEGFRRMIHDEMTEVIKAYKATGEINKGKCNYNVHRVTDYVRVFCG